MNEPPEAREIVFSFVSFFLSAAPGGAGGSDRWRLRLFAGETGPSATQYEDGTFKHFRVDKMDNVTPCLETFELTGDECVTLPREGKEEFEKVDMSAYSKYTFSMYGGKIQNVTMRFQNRMMGVVMDRFGRDVVTDIVDKEHFQITVPVAVSDQFYGWVFGLGNYVTIVGPESVKEGMKKALAKVTKRYE